uniref:Cytochrome P450 n=1 Tax=Scoparia dulcis TaxID=107240 RepID=A0A1W7HBX9_SCODU
MYLMFPLLFLVIILARSLVKFVYSYIYFPWKITKHFEKQGIQGPPYHLIYGNTEDMKKLMKEATSKPINPPSHDILRRIAPYYDIWSNQYGKKFLMWYGPKPLLMLSEPDMIKELLITNACMGKDSFNPLSQNLFGQGLVGLEGDKWALHRKIANQAFTMERVKAWVPTIVNSTLKEMDEWEQESGGRDEFELDVQKALENLSADIISRTAFGSSFEEGKRIFELQDQQTVLTLHAQRSVYFPGLRFLPTKRNRMMWKLEKEIRNSVRALIEQSGNHRENSRNFITLLMQGDGREREGLSVEEVVDECKTFYFAGKGTSARLLSWALLLLAMNQEWQDKIREEVFRACKSNELPTADNLIEFKLVTMVLQETMRLYPPGPMLLRRTAKKMKLGGLDIPANTQFSVPIIAVHHDIDIWGNDVNEFNPMRFSEPRKHLASYFPFGIGSRICIGQNLAMVEAKIVLAMIIQRFSLTMSPSYVHSPIHLWTLDPQYGAPIIFRRLNSS